MGPKKGTKQAAGIGQPTLSFQSRKPSAPSPSKKKASAAQTAPVPSTPPKRRSTRAHLDTPALVPASSDEDGELGVTGEGVDSDDDFTSLQTPAGPSEGRVDDDPFIVTSPSTSTPSRAPRQARTKADNQVKMPSLAMSTALPQSTESISRVPSPEAIAKTSKERVEERRKLDVKSKEVKALMKDAKVAMGNLQPIHADPSTHNDVHHILRVFDMTSAYGPCVGMSRLQRWERAKKWGLNPPEEIRNILTTVEGQQDVAYRENVLHGWV